NTVGPYIRLGAAGLRAGAHAIEVKIGGPDLHPGSAGSAGPIGPLLIARPNDDPRLVYVPAARAGELCGGEWDWAEGVGEVGRSTEVTDLD
ncbi:MAG TPA: hypothetical protein VF176_04345, partial [Solirubrobacterales bacterium]